MARGGMIMYIVDPFIHHWWNDKIIATLDCALTPIKITPRCATIAQRLSVLAFILDVNDHLNAYLSEYQYLNPLF